MQRADAEVMEKIRKLLALSGSSNEHEAALAASRAAELMLRHNISEAQLAVTTGEEKLEPVGEETLGEAMRRHVHWRGSLANVLTEHFGCDYFWNTRHEVQRRCKCGDIVTTFSEFMAHAGRQGTERHGYWANTTFHRKQKVITIRIVGRPTATQTCNYLYAYLVREIERLAEERYDPDRDENRLYTTPQAAARQWRESFRFGAINVIADRFREMRSGVVAEVKAAAKAAGTEAATCTALARIDDRAAVEAFVKRHHPKMRSLRGSQASIGEAGYAAGQAAGREMNLGTGRQGLGAPPKQLR